MFKKTSKKLNIIKILLLFNLIIKSISNKNISEIEIAAVAQKEGYDLTNPEDIFFNNICQSFAYDRKDITLEYRQKYFYLSKTKGQIPLFPKPIANNTKDCFYIFFNYPYMFFNISFYFIFLFFLFQTLLFGIILSLQIDLTFSYTPTKKMEIQKQYGYFYFLFNKCRKNNKKTKNQIQNFNELTQETNVNQFENTIGNFLINDLNNNFQKSKTNNNSEKINLKGTGQKVDSNNQN